jgi:hypothetical protein
MAARRTVNALPSPAFFNHDATRDVSGIHQEAALLLGLLSAFREVAALDCLQKARVFPPQFQ